MAPEPLAQGEGNGPLGEGKTGEGLAPRLRRTNGGLRLWAARRLDAVLLVFLLGNLSVLLASTMPRSYFFGLKAAFLRWLSRSLVYKGFLRAAPFGVLGCLAAAVAAAGRAPANAGARWRTLVLANGLLVYVQRRFYELVRGDASAALELEARADERELLAWEPPAPMVVRLATYPQRRLTPTVLLGGELLPERRERLLFVGNHAVWGLDVPLLLHALYIQEGVFPRPLGSHAWFAAPLMREVMATLLGGVDGTEHNCDLLMRAGHNLLVYPGGEREAWKKTSDTKYSLIWGESMGFARLALKHDYTIVPVATVGSEDVFEVAADFPLSKVLRLGGLIPAAKSKKLGGNAFLEGSTLPVLMPRMGELQRLYFKIGKPIKARPLAMLSADGFVHVGAGDPDDAPPGAAAPAPDREEVKALREEVREALEAEVSWLLSYRETDPSRYAPPARAIRSLRRAVSVGGGAKSRL